MHKKPWDAKLLFRVPWLSISDKEDDIYVSGSDDHGFQLDDLSGMKVTSAIAERELDYYTDNRVVYLCIDCGHRRGIVEGSFPYEIEFDYGGGEIKSLTCSCCCGYPCKHAFAAILQLRETLKLLEEQDGFDWTEDGYAAAISQGAFFSFVVDGKTTGSFVLP